MPLTWAPVVKQSQPTDRIDEHVPKENLQMLYGYSESNWAMDIRHRRSISGMVFSLAGAVIAWKTRVQPTVALSTEESEVLAASDIVRLGLFISAVLDIILQHQRAATTMYEDNDACQMVAESTSPTCQMRHIAIHEFALQDQTERNILTFIACASNANASDTFKKKLARFFLHVTMITFLTRPRSS
jgi:hypothetical protein